MKLGCVIIILARLGGEKVILTGLGCIIISRARIAVVIVLW